MLRPTTKQGENMKIKEKDVDIISKLINYELDNNYPEILMNI